MTIIGTVHEFNTRRAYATDGQRISWAVVENDDRKRVVAFIDHARGIEQVIDLHHGNLDLLTDAWVLNAYDNFHYRYGGRETQALRDELLGKLPCGCVGCCEGHGRDDDDFSGIRETDASLRRRAAARERCFDCDDYADGICPVCEANERRS